MSQSVHLETSIEVQATAQQVWDALVDWDSQGEWMIATRVRGDGTGVGGALAAFSGLGRVGFLDTMVITTWEPPHRCDVAHTGRVVRGTGTFIVEPLGDRDAKLVWIEDLDIPGGFMGRAGFGASRRVFMALVNASLRRFARFVQAR